MKALLIAVLMLFATAPALAAEPAPRIVTTLDPADGVAVVGQPVRLHVRVLFPGDMPRPPLVNVPEAPGAQIMRFESQALTVRDQIDGQTYVGKDFTFVVWPRRAGEITVPAPRVTVLDRSGADVGAAQGQATRLHVSVPPGVDASGPVLVSDRVEATQVWSPDGGLKPVAAGGAIVRIIHRLAADTPAMAMADFSFVAPPGVRVYADAPVSDDRVNRGDVAGRRTDKVTYVFEKPGRYALPALIQPWWNPQQREAQSLTLPGLEVTVTAAAAATAVATPASRLQRLLTPWGLVGVACLLLVVLALCLLASRLLRQWQAWCARRRGTAAWARRNAERAARAGDAAAAWQALNLWFGRVPQGEAARLRRDPSLAAPLAVLERAVFRADGDWSKAAGEALANAIRETGSRSEKSAADGERRGDVVAALPPLNP